jgi:hypothetical protein
MIAAEIALPALEAAPICEPSVIFYARGGNCGPPFMAQATAMIFTVTTTQKRFELEAIRASLDIVRSGVDGDLPRDLICLRQAALKCLPPPRPFTYEVL